MDLAIMCCKLVLATCNLQLAKEEANMEPTNNKE